MWTTLMIAQAAGWIALILCSPFIFVFVRKLVFHLARTLFPRDMVIQYQDNGRITEAYFIKQSVFRKTSYRKLSQEELKKMEAMQ